MTTAAPAGGTGSCCRTSAGPRTTAAARARITASAGRCRSRTCGTSPSTPGTSSRRPSAAARSPTTTSTAPQQDGVGYYQVTQRDGRRCSAADGYLAARPRNLTVITDALVTGVLIEGGRAAGVDLPARGPRRDRPGRGRGDPRGGRDRLAPAADAVRHRPGRPPARARHLRDRRPAVGRRQPHRPPVGPGDLVHPVAQGAVGVVRQRRLRPLAADPQGPADLQHRRGGRIRPERPEADRARPAVARAAGRVPRAGPEPTRPAAR